jgi:iron(III) transport system permease protein
MIYVIVVLLIPLLTLLWASLLPFYTVPSVAALARVSIKNYLSIMHSPGIIEAAMNTAIAATVTPTVTLAIATLVAWRSIRHSSWRSQLPDFLSFVILGTPSVVIGLAFMFLYLSLPVPIYGTLWIIIIAFVTRFLTYGTRTMKTAFIQIHPELEEASSMSGVGWWHTLRRIILPLVWSSFLRGWLWVFVMSVREVTLALMLVGVHNETLGARLWVTWLNQGNIAYSSTLAMMMVVVLSIVTFFIVRWTIIPGEGRGIV